MLADRVLLCEGVAGGRDVRLFEAARQALKRDHPVAGTIEVHPAGSKADLVPTIRALRSIYTGLRVVAVRDRDFLRTPRLADMRARAVAGEQHAYPLSRHSLESYLLEPAFVAAATRCPEPEIADRLRVAADGRVWQDIVRAVLDDRGYQARQLASASECQRRRSRPGRGRCDARVERLGRPTRRCLRDRRRRPRH